MVLDLIKSKKTIKPLAHFTPLAASVRTFGQRVEEVGNLIGLTIGETDLIEDKYEKLDYVSDYT